MTEKGQLKWHCVDCGEMLMDYMKNMIENLSKIKAQLTTKADKAGVARIKEPAVDLDERLTAVENGLCDSHTPAHPSLCITRETEQKMVNRAANEMKEHTERKIQYHHIQSPWSQKQPQSRV